jgi:PKD repeat protein
MKYWLPLSLLALIFAVASPSRTIAQMPTPTPIVYGSSPFQDSVWAFDTTTWQPTLGFAPTLAGFTISGINGMAWDPCEFKTYVILKVTVGTRRLATVNLSTGVCTDIGALGDNFSTLAFDGAGQLYGVTGDGATVSETLYLIDKTNAAVTLASALGNGDDGEIISYNPWNNKFFHWSGNGIVEFEKLLPIVPYTVSPISSNDSIGEVFGALCLGPNRILVTTINADARYMDTLGNVSATFGAFPDDLRGTIMPPQFEVSDDTVCVEETLFVGSVGTFLYDVIYFWGDGSADTVDGLTSTGVTHQYMSAGSRQLNIVLDNGNCEADTFATYIIQVYALPGVVVNPQVSHLCTGDTVLILGTGGGSRQWYKNGVIIPGATFNPLVVTTPGIYNMIKTNLNGCSDSANVGATVFIHAPATVTFNPASPVFCTGDSVLVIGSPANDPMWFLNGVSTGIQNDSIWVSTPGLYNMMATIACEDSASSGFIPVESPAAIASFTGPATGNFGTPVQFTNTSTNATSYLWNFGDGSPDETVQDPNHNFLTGGLLTVTLIASNSCSSDTTTMVIDILGAVESGFGSGVVSVFPNPNEGQFNLSLENVSAGNLTLSVFNAMGTLAFEKQIDHAGGAALLPLDQALLSHGIYFIQLTSSDAVATLTMVVE